MAFNQQRTKSYVTGASVAFVAPLASLRGAIVPLSGVTAGSTVSAAGLVIACAGPQWNIEWDSLTALVETDLTTSTITATSKWQGSLDGVNWVDILGLNAPANVTKSAAGTGSLVTTQYLHAFAGINPGLDYIRLAVQVGVVTGAAGDNCTVSYNFRKRSFLA